MSANAKIAKLNLAELKVIHYPDPRLAQPAEPLDVPDKAVNALAERMFELMFANHGVGLAATQLGLPARIFVACPTGRAEDKQVYVNPRLVSLEGRFEDQEGCLSVPGVHSHIRRASKAVIEAMDLSGQAIRQTGEGLLARIFQHETDHLDGRTIVDRMGSLARLAHRQALKDLREEFTEKR